MVWNSFGTLSSAHTLMIYIASLHTSLREKSFAALTIRCVHNPVRSQSAILTFCQALRLTCKLSSARSTRYVAPHSLRTPLTTHPTRYASHLHTKKANIGTHEQQWL
ncbi:hypothetical protein BCR33DRAFT_724890 [Rhizoclosmatium globosum]|uniref:Uncharacterized protein n=1 Tax=Rhizoclosmatium globosum TaxID=329046 RepID=A0A1Y2B271_9FUNG|nr:hypothetical protein BCR33DRAFT_724890 [Rhizoclosmatium globosum]|eukprot:ORY28929.1 hypothetical protein BCR33DRAFT_724890 [Rhizoclosmatium globosum]